MAEHRIILPRLHEGQRKVVSEADRFNVLECGRRFGKALALDTQIATPHGWSTMGALREGDWVFDDAGKPTQVVATTETMFGHECFEVEFSDGSKIVADADHRWLTETHAARKSAGRHKGRFARENFPTVVTTREIAATLTYGKRGDINHSIKTCGPLEYCEKSLPIDPYLLGLWLGDGSSDQMKGTTTYRVGAGRRHECPRKNGEFTSYYSLTGELRRLGVLKNKHVPRIYLEGSKTQREQLLFGLMDTDGTASKGGACCFDNMNKNLADSVYELLVGLGVKAVRYQKKATLYGKFTGICHRVAFTPTIPVFRLSRKLARQKLGCVKKTQGQRYIIRVSSCESVPVRCIQVAASSSLYLCGESCIPTHNTKMCHTLAITCALEGKPVGWFAPNYKILLPAQDEIFRILGPVAKTNRVERRAQLINGGLIEFWSLDDGDAGRSRKYARVIIDEASIAANMQEAWEQAIRPTLTDLRGDAWFCLTPKGRNYAHKLFERGQAGEPGWKSWRLRTIDNPHIPADEIEAARRELPKHVFEQEYLGIPADDGGNPFGLAAIRRCIGPMSTEKPSVFGIDLAKSTDWTWIIGLDSIRRVCVSERWQGDWGQTRSRLSQMIGNTPALMDSTGVGDPIVEDLQRVCPNVEGFKFTQMSKQQIMEGLAGAIQQSAVTVPDGILVAELESFEYEYTKTGVRYCAPEGQHDDGVCSLALANHKAGQPRITLNDWGQVNLVGGY